MTVATKIVNDALTLIGVASPISPPEAEQQSTAFSVLVDMLNRWVKDETLIGVDALNPAVVPSAISGDINEAPWATGALKALLAEALCPYFRVEPSPRLNLLISEAHETLLIHGAPNPEPTWPRNLPVGQGNYAPYGQTFFPGPDET